MADRGLSKLKSLNNFLFKGDDGREGGGSMDSVGWPKTRPVAAAATTAPVPINCACQKLRLAAVFLMDGRATLVCVAHATGSFLVIGGSLGRSELLICRPPHHHIGRQASR